MGGFFDSVSDPVGTINKAINNPVQGAIGAQIGAYDPMGFFTGNNPLAPQQQAASFTGPMPERPDFRSATNRGGWLKNDYRLDPEQLGDLGSLSAQQMDISKYATDPTAMNRLKERAFAEGDSPWLQLQKQKLGLETQDAFGKAARDVMGQQAAAESALAMRGGLSGGARERLAMGGANNLAAAQQGLRRSQMMGELGLGIQDDQTKLGLMQNLPGMERAENQFMSGLEAGNLARTTDADKFNLDQDFRKKASNVDILNKAREVNTQRSLDMLNAENQFAQNVYNQNMAAYAAGKQGEAMANSQRGGGGVLGLFG